MDTMLESIADWLRQHRIEVEPIRLGPLRHMPDEVDTLLVPVGQERLALWCQQGMVMMAETDTLKELGSPRPIVVGVAPAPLHLRFELAQPDCLIQLLLEIQQYRWRQQSRQY